MPEFKNSRNICTRNKTKKMHEMRKIVREKYFIVIMEVIKIIYTLVITTLHKTYAH